MDWDDLIEKWEPIVLDRNPGSEAMLKETYRFLAQRFIHTTVWKRQ